MKKVEEVKKEQKRNQIPSVLQRILNDKKESDSGGEKSSWSAAWCTDTISD